MKPCQRWEVLMDPFLDTDRQIALKNHLEECADCSAAISNLDAIETEISQMASEGLQDQLASSQSVRRRLIERAQKSRRKSITARLVHRWVPATVAALAILGGLVFLLNRDKSAEREPRERRATSLEVKAQRFSSSGIKGLDSPVGLGNLVRVAHGERVLLRVGPDRVGIDEDSRVRMVAATEELVTIELQHGEVACLVVPRIGRGDFTIETGPFRVSVIGTRFTVARSDRGLEVAVDEGTVRVIGPKEASWTVKSGETLTLASNGDAQRDVLSDQAREALLRLLSESYRAPEVEPVTSEPTPSEPVAEASEPTEQRHWQKDIAADAGGNTDQPIPEEHAGKSENMFDTWRRWVINGRLEDAERALTTHLELVPGDLNSWSLLADCRRKGGKWEGAVAAYHKVIDLAPPARANLARFRAGAILQDRLGRHAKAASLFSAYLDTSGAKALEAEAMVRLATSLVALGELGRARGLLERVLKHHSGNPIAGRARELIDEIQ